MYKNCTLITSRAATDMASNVLIILPPKHEQTKKTHTAKTDNKQPPTTATPRLLLPEERRLPSAILTKNRARPLLKGIATWRAVLQSLAAIAMP